jgi:lipopolysaccharide biosynthesis glycosyltransferase
MSVLHVSCAAEGGYVPHSAAMLHSVLTHRDDYDVHVHYLHGPSFSSLHSSQLEDMVERLGGEITFHCIPNSSVRGLPVLPQFTEAMWYRIFLPELLPSADRVLYLDADTIVVDGLSSLWETPLDGAYLAAVTNVFQPNHFGRPAQLGLPGPNVYFNSGVLLLNLDKLREDDCTAALTSFALQHSTRTIEWPDQDTLNVVLGQRRVPLHPRWNCMNSVLTFPHAATAFGRVAVRQARRMPGIRHFEGPAENKPWHRGCSQELRELYFQHRRETPWPHVELVGEWRQPRWQRDPRRYVSA